jgi:signal transduction histidine kinase
MPAVVLSVARAVRSLALLSSAAAVVIAVALYDDGVSGVDVLGMLVAIAPPVMLWILWAALRELAELPERLRRLPETARGHGDDLRQLSQELRTPGQRLLRVPVTLWRLRGVSELIRPHAAVLPFLSVWFLTLSAFAALAAIGEVVISLALLIAAAL